MARAWIRRSRVGLVGYVRQGRVDVSSRQCLLHGENVAGNDKCCSPTSGKDSTDGCLSRSVVMTATVEELPLARLDLCVVSEHSALDVASLDGENVVSSDKSSSESCVEGFTDYCICTPVVTTATTKEPPLERLEICVASEDSREVKMSRSSVTRVTPERAENRRDDDAPLLYSAPVVDGDTDHAVMAALCAARLRLHPHVRVLERF